jgi:hypothetical protein
MRMSVFEPGVSCGKARSSRYRKWAGCTTVMNGAWPEN